jgi:hypothetical protein
MMSDEQSTNPLNQLEQLGSQRRSGSKKGDFKNPLGDLRRTETSQVTAKGKHVMHGNYAQVTFRLAPDHAAAIDEIADREGASKADIKRWLVAFALSAYQDGARPEWSEEVIQRKIRMPDVEL